MGILVKNKAWSQRIFTPMDLMLLIWIFIIFNPFLNMYSLL
ncbi:hypothetical protein ALO_06968 [Acetonema longum DSM 6540]|uniref:Uncharacterized protein n=1 Tax=Acetonema longum DSM 6540 TaxID=1009370 RepID=F7NH50_9FIRM|nr:hypothetical protein ALO_06968 [Acetonema longum DSM 6540]